MKNYLKPLNNGANQKTIKQSNRCLVFDVLNMNGKCSRTQLARLTGLTKTSITNITNEMIDEGIISEAETIGIGVGRKQTMLEISPQSSRAIGVSINRDAVVVSLVNLKGEVLFEKRLPYAMKETSKTFLEKVFSGCDAAISANDGYVIHGIGVASIGPLNRKTGTILSPPNFRELKNIHIVSLLSNKYKMKVYLENDMNAAALAEKMFGYGRKLSNFIYVGVTRGIGAGIVVDNKLFSGVNGFAGEIGHISIDYKGRQCKCGNKGCIEMYASISAIEMEAKRMLSHGEKSIIGSKDEVNWQSITNAVRKGDKLAGQLIDMMIEYLAAGFVTLCNIHDPQVILLGHEIVEVEDLIISRLKERVNALIFSKNSEVDIKTSYFGAESFKLAGAAVLIYRYVNGDLDEEYDSGKEEVREI